MITFLDENDAKYGALATIKATNAVNGERSITGEIISGDIVLSRIERGWRLRFEDEYYVVTFAKPIDEGKNVQVSFDAVHQFFWDFGKSSVYDQLSDGSHTFRAYLDFIFNGSGYRYDIESSLTVKAFEKQSFGYKNRLSLFNDIITSSGVEFQVNGKVVRILAKVGTDLSTVVRKNFNLNELGIEKNIGDFVTYQKGFGAYFDEEDHSKGRLIAEYTSPLASVYGKLEADPLVDERYKQPESLLSALKETVDNSYTISVSLDMEDLTRAGYRYTQPVAGDYIMAINETLGFKEKIRIVSFTSEYDVSGQLIKHTVTCNDIGSVKKLSASYTQTQHQAANAEVNANTAYEFANKALVSANGKNTNYYGDTFPVDNPKGTLKKGDLLFLTVGDTVKQYYWNGADWVINPVLDDVEAFKEQIADELKDVPNREEFENKIAEELANSKAEIETQIETAKTQAESNAKEYADTINQETTKVAELANAAAGEIKADLVNVKNNLTATSLVANNAQASVDKAKQDLANSVAAVNTKVDSTKAELTQAKQDLTKVTSDLNTAKQDLANSVAAVNTKADSTKAELTQAKQDLTSHAQQLQTQANAQTELTKRVTTVETTANGTKTTVNELTKTVAQNGKDITSVTARTKKVEDDLLNTKTTLSQVKTTADSTSQKTATLETGLDGLSAKFENLKVGAVNLLKNSKAFKGSNITGSGTLLTETYNGCAIRYFKNTNPNSNYQDVIQFNNVVNPKVNSTYTISFWAKGSGTVSTFFHGPRNYLHVANGYTNQGKTTNLYDDDGNVKFDLSDEWQRFWVVYKLKNAYPTNDTTVSKHLLFRHDNKNTNEELWLAGVQLEEANIATEYSSNESDIESKVAEYKQNADQNYASLQTTVQKLDGTVQHNKTVAEQTAEGFKTRIESLETYKDGETTRANQYFESAKTETARQLTVERTAIAKDYVAKSRYTSDVAGIRNELSATTTTANTIKTNLANYQATNDRAVANLQSSVQTANGDISSLKTKVEAVPGQITSAVSAVESKIPTEIGTVNLLKNSKTFSGSNITGTGSISSETYQGCAVRHRKVTGEVAVAEFRNCVYPKLGGEYVASFWAKGKGIVRIFFYGENGCLGVASGLTSEGDTVTRGDGLFDFNLTTDWKRYWVKYKLNSTPSSATNVGKHLLFRTPPNGPENDVYLSGVQLEEGSVASGYEPSPEDTAKQISSLSSELKQTADGITLLATKTELNSAKNELQSGINTATNKANSAQNTANSAQNTAKNNAQTISTHTTQISALNTGLNAKVSQSDFNTLIGRVTTAENNITAKADELSSKISSVEGKIPTEIGSTNLLRKTAVNTENLKLFSKADTTVSVVEKDRHQVYKLTVSGSNKAGAYFGGNGDYYNLVKDRNYTFSFWVLTNKDKNYNMNSLGHIQAVNTNSDKVGNDPVHQHTQPVYSTSVIRANTWTKVWCTFKATSNSYFIPYFWYLTAGDVIYIYDMMLNEGKVPLSYTPAPEDTISQISSLSSELKQTADGITLLATKTELNSAKNELQSGINTATNKANSAQTTANSNAQTISNHTTQISALTTGLNAKVSQSDFNTLIGRVTTAENNITAKADELSSKISSVEGKLPSGETNLVDYGRPANGYSPYAGAEYTTHAFYYNSAYKMYIIRNTGTSEKLFRMNRFKVERNTDYTLYFKGFNNSAITNMDVWFLKRVSGSSNDYDSAQILVSGRKLSNGSAEDISVTFNTGNYDEGYLRFDNNGTSSSGTSADLYFGDVSIKKGKSNSGWSPSLAELASSQDLKTAQSEFKQTTDAIKASVSSLDKSTVKSSSLTINADGIVMKAGKSTTDVANAIGSYFSVNQNAINLFSDKINVKGSMIVSGAITSDKIASKQINTAHLNGKIITADVISSNAVTADAIKAGAVTTDKMSANSINGDRITAGTLDAAKIKAGSITASQIASGTITSEQIKAGTISAAKIAAGAITSDKIASNSIDASKIASNSIDASKIAAGAITSDKIASNSIDASKIAAGAITSDKIASNSIDASKIASNSIDASKIAAGAITANMITGGQLRSTNGATMFDLNAGTITFNNNSGYIQRVAGDKIFAITTSLSKTSDPSLEYLTSAFQIRKSDNSRYAGLKFSLYNDLGNKPIATAKMNADEFILSDSKNTQIFSVCGKSSWSGTFNLQGWRDIPVAEVHGGLIVKDIGIGGHIKSLLKIVEELCNKTGIMWI